MSDSLVLKIGEKQYDITPPFTNRELHLIKQVSGVRSGELFDALESGDSDVLVALAHIGVKRKGTQRPSLDELWDLEAGTIEFVEPDETPVDPTPAPVSGSPETTPQEPGSLPSVPLPESVPAMSGT